VIGMKITATAILVSLNVALATAYLILGSKWWWLEPELADEPVAYGGVAFVWFGASCYTLLMVAILNLTFLTVHAYRYVKLRERTLTLAALAIPAVWALTVWIDFAHHYH